MQENTSSSEKLISTSILTMHDILKEKIPIEQILKSTFSRIENE